MLFSIVAATLALGGHAYAGCSLDQATYRDTAEAGFKITFARAGPRDQMIVTSDETSMAYSFFMDQGNGYSSMMLTPVEVADGRRVNSIFAYAIREDLSVSGEFPSRSDPAPLYVFVPELGRLLWYQAESLGGPSLMSGQRESLPRAFFKLSGCER